MFPPPWPGNVFMQYCVPMSFVGTGLRQTNIPTSLAGRQVPMKLGGGGVGCALGSGITQAV